MKAENAALRRQLIVLRRKVQGRVRLTNNDRWFPSILQVLTIIRTIVLSLVAGRGQDVAPSTLEVQSAAAGKPPDAAAA